MSKPTELPDLDKLEAYATSSKNGDWHATEAMLNMLDEDDILALVVAARRAQPEGPEGEAPQAAAHRATIEEAAQVLESAAAHNRAKGRTVLERTQQDRADRLRAILTSPAAQSQGAQGVDVIGGQRWSKEAEMTEGWLAAQQAAAPDALVAILRDVHDTLASESDSDIDHFEDDEEEREGAPVQYAARKVMEIIDLIETEARGAPSTTEALADPVVEANRKLLLERSSVGIGKYGKTLADADLTSPALVQHALEEALDLANYLQAILRKQRVAELDGSRGEVHG